MRRLRSPLTSVTHWLLMVVGCAVLETAQPMLAAPSETAPPPRANDTVIYPQGAAERVSAPAGNPGAGNKSFLVGVALLLSAGGAWLLIQRRHRTGPAANRLARKLQIDETRPLGNRQYLVVANYEGRKFLLGVTPGQIQMLTPLGAVGERAENVS